VVAEIYRRDMASLAWNAVRPLEAAQKGQMDSTDVFKRRTIGSELVKSLHYQRMA
jgi:hypothetical protein